MIFKKSVLEVLSPLKCFGFASEAHVLSLCSKLTCDIKDKDLFAESLLSTGISIFTSTAVGPGPF